MGTLREEPVTAGTADRRHGGGHGEDTVDVRPGRANRIGCEHDRSASTQRSTAAAGGLGRVNRCRRRAALLARTGPVHATRTLRELRRWL